MQNACIFKNSAYICKEFKNKLIMSKFTFTKKETNKKNQAFEYSVTDEAGNVLMTRGSNREYIAVMVCQDKDGKIYVPNFFFSRLDLVGKGDSRYEVKNQIATAVLE